MNDKQDVSLPQASAVLRSAEINWPWGFRVAVMVFFFPFLLSSSLLKGLTRAGRRENSFSFA